MGGMHTDVLQSAHKQALNLVELIASEHNGSAIRPHAGERVEAVDVSRVDAHGHHGGAQCTQTVSRSFQCFVSAAAAVGDHNCHPCMPLLLSLRYVIADYLCIVLKCARRVACCMQIL